MKRLVVALLLSGAAVAGMAVNATAASSSASCLGNLASTEAPASAGAVGTEVSGEAKAGAAFGSEVVTLAQGTNSACAG
jgi:hypothetical protein